MTAYPFHPTRRDILLILIITTLFGLFLQLDFSLRFTDSSGSNSLLGFKVGFGGRPDRNDDWDEVGEGENSSYGGSSSGSGGKGKKGKGGAGGDWTDNIEVGAKAARLAGMDEAKVYWGEEGATRTEVLAHAPGLFVFQVVLDGCRAVLRAVCRVDRFNGRGQN